MGVFMNGVLLHFLFVTMVVPSESGEPQCSKFPYEEALLEKMVRMEFEVQMMREGINKVKEQVVNELDIVKETRVDVQKLSEKLSRDRAVTRDQLNNTVKQLETNVSILIAETMNYTKLVQEQNEGKLATMSEDLITLKNESIPSILEKYVVPNVQFAARALKKLAFSKDQTVIFDTILGKDGNGYNERTGVFTAPFSGSYIFTTQLCGQPSNYFEFAFMVNGDEAQRGLINGLNGSPCWSSLMIRRLDVGHRVFVKDVAGGNTLNSDTYRWNVFSGILISRKGL